ncbi:hypothetical protein BCE_0381 [Bacillus cereus ATCC 10987]|uniref:Uncharacterized protein n=1 Tax=Bacillus cereus (strain ATCC 10987 / NRS 248) TaxID=222523 RepID=Q73EH7_BACC1|nr:hypothetical protein BCE_0381 [Bacillus cereus ATCC 10987]
MVEPRGESIKIKNTEREILTLYFLFYIIHLLLLLDVILRVAKAMIPPTAINTMSKTISNP